MAQLPHIATDEQRRIVRAMASYGIPQPEIARVVGCSPPTLRKAYRDELDTATTQANARVAQCLFQQATTPGNIAATIFWLKVRAGWSERQSVEVSGPGGKPVVEAPLVIIRQIIDPADTPRPPRVPVIEGDNA